MMDHGSFPYYAVRLDAHKCRELDVDGHFRLAEFVPIWDSPGEEDGNESTWHGAQTRRNKGDSA